MALFLTPNLRPKQDFGKKIATRSEDIFAIGLSNGDREGNRLAIIELCNSSSGSIADNCYSMNDEDSPNIPWFLIDDVESSSGDDKGESSISRVSDMSNMHDDV